MKGGNGTVSDSLESRAELRFFLKFFNGLIAQEWRRGRGEEEEEEVEEESSSGRPVLS
jgi:hypothetical protein